MKIKKKISGFFIGLLGMLFLAHIVVPHHHHYNTVSAPGSASTENCHHETNKVKETDYHCHAFNNLVVHNYRDQLVGTINQYPGFFIHNCDFALFPKETEESAYRVFNHRIITQYYYLYPTPRPPPYFS